MAAGNRAAAPDRTVMVTGASGGIGRAVAARLAPGSKGMVLVGRDRGRLGAVARGLAPAQATSVPADLREPGHAAEAVAQAIAALGRIDVLVNGAGIYREGPFQDLTTADLLDLVATNLTAAAAVIRSALPAMGEGACIVNIASMSAVRALPQQSLYAATKAAVVHLGSALAAELAPRGIRVNTVSPGPADTDVLLTVYPPEEARAIKARLPGMMPIRRLVAPEEIADAVEFCCRNGAATGAHLVIDGGITR